MRLRTKTHSKKYDQAFFLGLAAQGKDAWNAWRRDTANEAVRVTFAGVNFSEAPCDKISFEGFEFGEEADFSGCQWRGIEVTEMRSQLAFQPGRAFFCDTVFGFRANFSGASFGGWANFRSAIFGQQACFTNKVTFGEYADFTLATFGHLPDFTSVTFEGAADFTGASFGIYAKFSGAHFTREALFKGVSEEKSPPASGDIRQRHEAFWKTYGLRPDRFKTISFANAHFDGEANFSGRLFQDNANFTDAEFFYPPNFDNVTGASRIDLTGTHVGFKSQGKFRHWTEDSLIPVRLRALRKFAEETKNHDFERDLYIEERKAERGIYLRQRWEGLKKDGWKAWPRNGARLITHILWIIIMGIYWLLADYGRSFLRPFVWLIATGFFFYWSYLAVLAPIMRNGRLIDIDKYEQAVRMLALGNAVPFVGPLTIDSEIKRFLFCPGCDVHFASIPPESYQLLALGQNLFSTILIFLMGLALRNYFKIK